MVNRSLLFDNPQSDNATNTAKFTVGGIIRPMFLGDITARTRLGSEVVEVRLRRSRTLGRFIADIPRVAMASTLRDTVETASSLIGMCSRIGRGNTLYANPTTALDDFVDYKVYRNSAIPIGIVMVAFEGINDTQCGAIHTTNGMYLSPVFFDFMRVIEL